MLLDTSTCVADHNDELSKDSVNEYVAKLMRNPYLIFHDRARAESVRKCKHPPWDREPSRIPYNKTSNLFRKDKVIRECMVHDLKKKVPSSSELRKYLYLGFRKYIAVRIFRPRPQLRRNKSSREVDSNCCFYLITRRIAKL